MKINAEHGFGTGLGDIVCLCWFPEATFYVERPAKQQIFDLFGRTWTDQGEIGKPMEGAFHADLNNLRDDVPRLTSWKGELGLNIIKRPKAHISQLATDWAEVAIRRHPKPIMLFPRGNQLNRQWPANYWLDLAWKLKTEGYNPMIMLETKDDQTFKQAPSVWQGYTFELLAALMRRALLVVGNDSFPAHLAGTLGVPTLVLAGPTTPPVYDHCPSVEMMMSHRTPCVGCCYAENFRASCDLGCHALYALFPDEVLERIKEKVEDDC